MLKVFVDPRGLRALIRIPAKEREKLLGKIVTFAASPKGQHAWARLLTGRPGLRIRQGDYRVICLIDQETETLTVIDAGHRKEVYR